MWHKLFCRQTPCRTFFHNRYLPTQCSPCTELMGHSQSQPVRLCVWPFMTNPVRGMCSLPNTANPGVWVQQ